MPASTRYSTFSRSAKLSGEDPQFPTSQFPTNQWLANQWLANRCPVNVRSSNRRALWIATLVVSLGSVAGCTDVERVEARDEATDAGVLQEERVSAKEEPEAALRQLLKLPPHFQLPEIPPYNLPTPEKIRLGRHLFYDTSLSANETQSCASCHQQQRAFAEALPRSVGSTGETLTRNSQGLSNVAYLSTLTWASDGLLTLEDQIHVPLTSDNPIELGLTDGVRASVLARFEQDAEYQAMFFDAFPETEGKITLNQVIFALASFCRTMVSGSSPFDRALRGDKNALTEKQKRGRSLFSDHRFECFHCHGGSLLTNAYHDANRDERTVTFFNTGLYNVDGEGSYPAHDQGLFELTFRNEHRGLFRPPSLRNVAVTAPYMHDGSMQTLREVIAHYANGGRHLTTGPFAGDGRTSPLKSGLVRGFRATDEEIDALVAFLESLTDQEFLTRPSLANPNPSQ